ncbi:MAG: hypothetical protein KOO69_01000, partial [Victivallales bacterium]|nr:hypothetical protein [Victivallales bacterium]
SQYYALFYSFTAQTVEEPTKYRRQGEPNETIIEISPDEYEELTKESVIDCNSIKNISLNELVHKFENKFLVGCDDLSNELVKKIICGVHKSRHVSNKIKQLLK